MKTIRELATVGLIITAVAVARSGAAEADATAEQPRTAPATADRSAGTVSGGTGKVLETMNSGGYTYVKADIGGAEVWAAAPQFSVKTGDVVTIPEGVAMTNYHSNTLNRTFDVVSFVSSIAVQGANQDAIEALPGHGGGAAAMDHGGSAAAVGHGGSAAARPAAVEVSGIKRAEGGKTVEELFQGKEALSGKDVAVRGKVVKVSAGIMGTNWIHVQDGTGKPGTNDLVVTTNTLANVGDTVVVKGPVSTDKDFGFGYKYDVILENAALTKE